MREAIEKTKALLQQGWTTGAFARDAEGKWTDTFGNDAVCWCLIGALARATDAGEDFSPVINAITRKLGGMPIPDFNDAQTFVEPVIALLDSLLEELPQ